jgi:hypothetical protein
MILDINNKKEILQICHEGKKLHFILVFNILLI